MDFGLFDDRPAAVRRFQEILRTAPLVVIASDERVTIRAVQLAPSGKLVERYDWPARNWDVWAEACVLFWSDADVWGWICAHPHAADGLHYKNLTADEWIDGMPVVDIEGPKDPAEKPKVQL